MSNPAVNTEQVQANMRSFIVYLVINHRPELINALNSSGIYLTTPKDKELISTIYKSIATSTDFRNKLQSLMQAVASKELNSGPMNVTLDQFVIGKGNKPGFANSTGEGADTGDYGEGDAPSVTSGGGGGGGGAVTSGGGGGGGGFGSTGVGTFLGNLFTPTNVNKYITTGLALVQQNAAQKTGQQQIDLATLQLQQQQTALMAAGYAIGGGANPNTPPKTNTWVVPVIIGVVVIGAIITIVLVSKKKK